MQINSSSGGGRALVASKSSVTRRNKTSYLTSKLGKDFADIPFEERAPLYLQRSAFYFSSCFSSCAGWAPWQPPPSAAAWPWTSRCHRSSGWESPGGRRDCLKWTWTTDTRNNNRKMKWGSRTTSLSALRNETSGPPLTVSGESRWSIFSHDSALRCISWPGWIPPTPLANPRLPGTHTKQALCSPNTFHLSVSRLTLS